MGQPREGSRPDLGPGRQDRGAGPRAASPQASEAWVQGQRSEPGRSERGRPGRDVSGARVAGESGRGAGSARGDAGRPFLPAGWPPAVLPPGVEDWERSAVAFLLDCCPADFRGYPVLRRHPVVLAQFAGQVVEAQVRASEDGLARARLSLREQVEPQVVEEAVRTWHEEIARLRAVRAGIGLVDDALRGMVFVPRL